MTAPSLPAAAVEADLARIDTGIRRLKTEYDMFFAGALQREPIELRSELDALIKRYTRNPFRKYAHRFHFNALVSRYNSLSELWTKTVRTREEGTHRPAAATDRFEIKERLLARCKLGDPDADVQNLRRLHSRYVDARRRAGRTANTPSFEGFVRGIDQQVQRLRESAGCDQIELRLVIRDDKVQLKARPGR